MSARDRENPSNQLLNRSGPIGDNMVDDNYFLKVSNLTVELQKKVILENVSFQIKKGTTLAVVGPNGADLRRRNIRSNARV